MELASITIPIFPQVAVFAHGETEVRVYAEELCGDYVVADHETGEVLGYATGRAALESYLNRGWFDFAGRETVDTSAA